MIKKYQEFNEDKIYKRDIGGRFDKGNASSQIYSCNYNYFKTIDSEDKAYWLGFMYADGCVIPEKNTGRVQIGLSTSDKKHIELFKKWINSNHTIIDFKSKRDNISFKKEYYFQSRLRISSLPMVNDLINKGCVPNKSLILKFPTFLNDELRNHFIRGYFDGDGCIYVHGLNMYQMTLAGTNDFLSGIKDTLESIGIKNVGIYKDNGKNIYLLKISNYKDNLLFYNYIYGDMKTDCYLKRKKDKYDKILIFTNTKSTKNYKITDPDGKIYLTERGLKQFCRDHNLYYGLMQKVSYGVRDNYKGWKCEEIKK